MILLATAALAASPERFPLRAEVALPPEGPARIAVPLGLRSAADPEDGSDLLLVDATGRAVPFARVEGSPTARDPVAVTVGATADPTVFTVDLGPLPVDVLEVEPHGVPSIVVRVLDRDARVLAGPAVLFALPGGGRHVELPIPPTSGRITVEARPTYGRMAMPVPSFRGWRTRAPGIAPERIPVTPAARVVQENGLVRYPFALDRPLPIDRARIEVAGPVFERQASLEALPWHDPPEAALGIDLVPTSSGRIVRLAVGDATADLTEVPGPATRSDRLALLVDAQGQPPLEVDRIVLEVDGVHLLVLDAGPGPHTLYGGAPPGTSPAWDLRLAGPELARATPEVARPGPVGPNPAWVPPELRANLAGPGAALDPVGWRWQRPVEGRGLARIPLPAEVLSSARADLGDLRLVSEGRQVPYVLRRRVDDPPISGVTVERTERDGRSVLRIRLPEAGLPVSRVTLVTPAPVFERQVTVSRARGTALEPLRSVRWQSTGRDRATLDLAVPAPLDDELVVEIDNGDDPPLPVDEVTVRAVGWELLAIVPEGGATLLYGAPDRARPEYDLALLAGELGERAATVATLGERAAVARPRIGAADRVLLALGVGVLAVGLLVLAGELVRRLPDEAAPA